MYERPDKEEYASFYEGYINLIPEGNVIEILEQQAEQVQAAFHSLSEEEGNYRYSEGKWSVKEVLGHLSPEAWLRKGIANNYTASARAIACVIAGHELHHLAILRDRYNVLV